MDRCFISQFAKGELNKLNDINQEIKNVFSQYHIFPNGICVGDSIMMTGKHFSITDYRLSNMIDNEHISSFTSTKIFELIKNSKKDINGYKISDRNIYLTGTNIETQIGFIEPMDSALYYKHKTEIETASKLRSTISTDIRLTEDEVIDLVKNNCMPVTHGRYRTRITRELIPGLKKKHEVSISFRNDMSNSELFNMYIIVNRSSSVKSYHIYTCLFMDRV